MKKLAAIGFAVTLLVTISLFGAGAPVFIGTTTDYWTNGNGYLTLIASNGNVLAVDRVNKQVLFYGSLSVATQAVAYVTVSQGIGTLISTATRYGGALTNVTLDANGPQVVHVNGATNVNIVAMMNWAIGLQRPVTLLITNRTATPRTLSLETTTNNWIGLGSLTAPLQVTNALWIAFENLGTSNVVYAVAYAANPTN